jgi:hypothetical protein
MRASQPLPTQDAIVCPRCAAHGVAIWEAEKTGPFLVSLSEEFYERLVKFAPYRVEIVCHACGTPQPQRFPLAV